MSLLSAHSVLELVSGRESSTASALLDLMGHGVIVQSPDARILLSNRAARDMLGLTKSQLEGRDARDPPWSVCLADGSPLPGEAHPAAVALRTGKAVEGFVMGVDRPRRGDRVWIEVSATPEVNSLGEVCLVVVCFNDVSERFAVQAELTREHALLTQVMNTSVTGFAVLNPSGRIVYANPSAEQILGLNRSQIEARRYDDPEWRTTDLDGGPWPDDKQPFVQVLRSRAPVYGIRHCIEWPTGERKALSINGAPVLDAAGKVERLVFALKDITAELAAETERRQLERTMERISREESLAVLAGGVAHDFNNLLVGMFSASELAVSELPRDHPAQSALNVVRQTAKRATELTKQLLAYSGRGHFVIEAIDLSQVARDTRELTSVLNRSVTFELDLADDLPAVQSDALQLKQIILNLALNAVEATVDTGGRVTIRTRAETVSLERLESVGAAAPDIRPGVFVLLEVEDNGIGIAPEHVGRIFEPFFSTKATGHGLGLAAVVGVMRSHGGFAAVESALERGTKITIGLPPSEHPAATELPARTPPSYPVCKVKGPVLVVDDEEVVRNVVGRVLKRQGVETWMADNGESALRRLANGDRPEIVLLDLTMPKMGGVEVLARIRDDYPELPVVLTSGYAEGAAEVFDAHTSFIAKPFSARELVARLEASLST